MTRSVPRAKALPCVLDEYQTYVACEWDAWQWAFEEERGDGLDLLLVGKHDPAERPKLLEWFCSLPPVPSPLEVEITQVVSCQELWTRFGSRAHSSTRFVPPTVARAFSRPQASAHELRVCQFNLLHDSLSGSDFPNRGGFANTPLACLNWEFRRGRLAAEIIATQPHVVCMQECPREFTLQGYRQVYVSKPNSPNDGCALLVLEARFAIKSEWSFQFGSNHVAACALVEDLVAGGELVLCAAHLKAGLACESVRETQAETLTAKLAELSAGVERVILCADLNGSPGLPAYEVCRRHFRSAMFDLLGGTEPEYTTRKQRGELQVSRTIDYIFYRGGNKLLPVRCWNLPVVGFLPSWHYPSDHLMLCVGFH